MATDSIPTFRKFIIRGQAATLEQLVSQLPAYLPPTWQRDTASEASAKELGDEAGDYRCFRFAGSTILPMATLWLFLERNQAQVVNIVAPNEFELGYERYNTILAEFAAAVAQAIAATGLPLTIAPWHEPTLEQVLEPEPARLFKRFARLANPSTGTAHPADAERWQDFLISAHQHQVMPDADLLRRWLKAECHWPESTTDATLDDMQKSLDLLQRFQQTVPPAAYGHAA